MKRNEVEYHHLPGSRQADSSHRLLALIVSRHAARARYPPPPPSSHHCRYPSVVAVSLFSGMLPPLVGLPHHTGKWGNKLPTARRDFFGDLGPDRVCVSLGHTQTAAGGTCWKFTWAWIDTGIRGVSSVYIGLFRRKNLTIFSFIFCLLFA